MKLMQRIPKCFAFMLICAAPALAQADAPELFTSGHGDIAVEYEEAQDDLHVHWFFEGAIVGGKVVGEKHEHEEGEQDQEHEHDEGAVREMEDVIVATHETFTRPSGVGFELLGVEEGQEVFYLPQSGDEAEQLNLPFLGWAFEAPEGVFKANSVQLILISVSSPQPGNATFSLWSRSGLTPEFVMSSADGVSNADTVSLSGHEHFALGLGQGSEPRDLTLEFEARAEKVNGEVLTKRFSVAAKTCEGECRAQAAPAPVLGGGLAPLGLLFGLGGLLEARRRERA